MSLSQFSDKVRECLRKHYKRIIQCLNMRALLPHLLEKGLLTDYEWENLEKLTAHEQSEYFILRILPRKGEEGFKRFLECLRAEKEHLGHHSLADVLYLNFQEYTLV